MNNLFGFTHFVALIIFCFLTLSLQGQYVHETFRGTRVINGHSVEMLQAGEMEMIINHRFGRVNSGAYNFFGLDQANIRIGFDYGVNKRINIGLGRSSLGKEFDGFVKVNLLKQAAPDAAGMPVSVTFFSSLAYNSLRNSDPLRPVLWQNRLAYTSQLYIARKFSDRLSLQLMPTYVHFNLVDTNAEPNDKLALGAAGKFQLSKNWAITSEYYYVPEQYLAPGHTNALSVGFDLNTGSHVFQFHFTNSDAMIEKQFIGETNGKWLDGDIHLGFNIVRTFKLKGRRY